MDKQKLIQSIKTESWNVKTPIMFLNELCTKLNMKVVYENISIQGKMHKPIFEYRLKCGNICQTGKGKRKKIAKQEAALAMLKCIKSEMINQFVATIDDYLSSINKQSTISDQYEPYSDFVSELFQLSQKCSFGTPLFEFKEEEGFVNNKQFSCKITFGSMNLIDTGRTKKQAKRNAASKLMSNLKEISFILNEKIDSFENSKEFKNEIKPEQLDNEEHY
jgi:RISC-loading complex subunit TARBP2